jgi:hypothetical protein
LSGVSVTVGETAVGVLSDSVRQSARGAAVFAAGVTVSPLRVPARTGAVWAGNGPPPAECLSRTGTAESSG